MRLRSALASLLFAAACGGGSGQAQLSVHAEVPALPPPPEVHATVDFGFAAQPPPPPPTYVAPNLVTVSPGVEVVADNEQPVFFHSGMYWHNDGGVWFSSYYHTGGWVKVSTPPPEIVQIKQPTIYVHYHPPGVQIHVAPAPVVRPVVVVAAVQPPQPPTTVVEVQPPQPPVVAVEVSPVAAIEYDEPTFDTVTVTVAADPVPNVEVFYDQLAPYGTWYDDPTYGWVFTPTAAAYIPYTNGYWKYTAYGTMWVSNDAHGSSRKL
jgi:hypothetical protein